VAAYVKAYQSDYFSCLVLFLELVHNKTNFTCPTSWQLILKCSVQRAIFKYLHCRNITENNIPIHKQKQELAKMHAVNIFIPLLCTAWN